MSPSSSSLGGSFPVDEPIFKDASAALTPPTLASTASPPDESPITTSTTPTSPRPAPPTFVLPIHPPGPSYQGNIVPASPPDRSSLKCAHSPSKGRNLALCVDGTANQFGMENTNVVELYARLIKDENQLTYYNSGIGTYAKPSYKSWSYIKQVVDHKIDMAIAWRFESIIHAAYEWLSENYRPGDRIFLFGFSRGAYQVRVIAGMIERVGLLHKGNKSQIPFAYELYTSTTDGAKREDPHVRKSERDASTPKSDGIPGEGPSGDRSDDMVNEMTGGRRPIGNEGMRKPEDGQEGAAGDAQTRGTSDADKAPNLCAQFKRTLCHPDVQVHFVGAWDTVSSIGIARGMSLPETTTGMAHVCVFRHALALDERRVKFQPEYVNGGLGPTKTRQGDVKEVWFAGSHSDIGGGNIVNNNLDNFGPALRWMTYEAMRHGLRMHPYQGKWPRIKPTESLTGMWLLFELLPFRRLSYRNADDSTHSPHLAMPRIVQPGQLIHESVFDLMGQDNVNHGTEEKPMPGDDYHACQIDSDTPSGIDSRYYPSSIIESGVSASWDGLLKAFQRWKETQTRNQDWYHMMQLPFGSLEEDNPLPKVIERDPFATASHALDLLRKSCVAFMENRESNTCYTSQSFGEYDACINILRSDLHRTSIAEVPNAANTLLAALEVNYWRSHDTSLQFENLDLLIRLLLSLPNELRPNERQFKISQIQDWTSSCKIYQGTTDQLIERFGRWIFQSQEVDFDANFARFSTVRDGSILICDSSRCTVWDLPSNTLTTIYEFPDQAYNDRISNVRTTSADGSFIAYGSIDPYAVTIFDPKTQKHIHGPDLNDSQIFALSFSHNSTLLASGSRKGLVTVWMVSAGKLEPHQFFGHIGDINALAFAPDDSLLASACDDQTVRVWDIQEAEKQAIVLRGHDSCVDSVTWSPSGDRIASGGQNGMIVIWDLQGNVTFNQTAHSGTDIWAIAFSPHGHILATGGDDHTLRLWKCENQKQLWCLDMGRYARSVAFSADGLRLVTSDDRGIVRIWDMDTCQPAEEAK